MIESVEREQREDGRASRRAPHRPSLSVVLLSQGDRRDLERALAAVAGRCQRMEAEIIVVRSANVEDAETLRAAYPCVTFLAATGASSDAELREIGMQRALGDIVALRMDGAVGDGLWLDAFHATVGSVEHDALSDIEVALTPVVERAIPTESDAPMSAPTDRRRAYAVPTLARASMRRNGGMELDAFAPSIAHER